MDFQKLFIKSQKLKEQDKFQFVGWVKIIVNTNEIRVGFCVPPFNLYIEIKKEPKPIGST